MRVDVILGTGDGFGELEGEVESLLDASSVLSGNFVRAGLPSG